VDLRLNTQKRTKYIQMGYSVMATQISAKPLDGRLAAITGVSSGIGEAVAEHLAWLGVKVAVLARREGRLEDLVARIEKNGGSAVEIAADVTDAAAVQTQLQNGGERAKDLDGAVHAGHGSSSSPAGDYALWLPGISGYCLRSRARRKVGIVRGHRATTR
jgi:hypothetical protein